MHGSDPIQIAAMARFTRSKPTPEDQDPPDIAKEIAVLRREIAILNKQRFLVVHNSLWRLFALRFMSGLFTGLGTVIGATVLVSVVVYWLQGIEWVPLVGEWASEIATQIEQNLETAVESGVERGMGNAAPDAEAPTAPSGTGSE